MQASEMSTEAKSYFSQLTATVPAHHWLQWEREIKNAESCWLVDPTAMDMIGTHDAPRDDNFLAAVEPEVLTCTEKWIQKAIDIEERQCVHFLRMCSHADLSKN
jgi:hypothetical protein